MNENDEIEIDLSRVFEIIKKHFKPFALIILAASIVAALITLFLIPKKYTAEAKLIIVQKSNPDSQQISYNDLQTSQKLVNTYSEILKSEAISDEVIQNLKLEDLDTEGYQKIVKISSVKDTEVITIAVTSKDPKEAAVIANEIVDVFRDKIYSIMNIENISLRKEMTVEEAILKIRQVGINKETIYTCYVTEKKKLIGSVDVKDLLTVGESRLIEEIMDENVLCARTLDDQEKVWLEL